MGAGLVFDGDIDFLSGIYSEDGYLIEAIEGMEFGAPQPIEVTIAAMLRDGTILAKTGDDNRDSVAFPFRIKAADSMALALGEQRVALAIGKPTTMEYTPPDGIGPTTVFKVLTSSLAQPFDDLAEVRLQRTYRLRLVCEPFTRSVDLITDDAGVAPSSGGTVLDPLEDATDWSTWDYAPVTHSVDAVTFHEGAGCIAADANSYSLTANSYWNGDFSYAVHANQVDNLGLSSGAGGYWSVWIKTDWTDAIRDNYGAALPSGLIDLYVKYGTGAWTEVTFTPSEVAADGFVRYVWEAPAGQTLNGLRFNVRQNRFGHAPAVPKVRYDAVTLSTSATTDNQIVKTFTVEGSARAPGSLHVASPDDSVGLGSVLVATVPSSALPSGSRPDVRRWVTAGSTTVDATALGGSYYTSASYSSATQFEIPVSALPSGRYFAVVLLKASGATLHTFGVETQLTFSGTATGGASSTEASFTPAAAGWMFAPVGSVLIPDVMAPGSAAEIRVRVKGGNFAEVYLIPEAADFTIAECGSSTVSASGSSSHLWIDSPTPDLPSGGWWRGPESDGENRRRLSLVSELTKPGLHTFTPGQMLCFLTTTNAAGPTVSLSYYPHWHTHAAL